MSEQPAAAWICQLPARTLTPGFDPHSMGVAKWFSSVRRTILWIAGLMAVSVAVVFAVRLLQDGSGINLTLFSPPTTGPSAPRIDAVVKAVSHEDKLVLLSAGKDQKVEVGLEFTVYRGPEFIGKVKVFTVYPDLAGAEVIYTKEKAVMQAGDRASTSLPSTRE